MHGEQNARRRAVAASASHAEAFGQVPSRASRYDRYVAKHRLLGAAAAWMASDHQLDAALPGPNDDAQAEYHDDWLLAAAREFVAAHTDINLTTKETTA